MAVGTRGAHAARDAVEAGIASAAPRGVAVPSASPIAIRTAASRRATVVLWGLSALLLLFLAIPVGALLVRALESGEGWDARAFEVLRQALGLSLATTALAMVFVIALGTPLAFLLARSRFPGAPVVEALVDLPIVLPPTVLGFYILIAVGPMSPFGRTYEAVVGRPLAFSFQGLLLASVLYSLPFAVRPFMAAFAAVDRRLIEASWCLGVSRLRTFLRIAFPLSWAGILTGVILSFAHTLGEFGVVLMVGGNIPGVTRTVSISIYDEVQAVNYSQAATTSLVLLASSFLALSVTHLVNRKAL